jgi:hypothetical protein
MFCLHENLQCMKCRTSPTSTPAERSGPLDVLDHERGAALAFNDGPARLWLGANSEAIT